jgi:hypothetical protein
LTYQTNIQATDVISLLGHDPRHKNWHRLDDDLRQIYETVQRKTSKARREGTARYIRERMSKDARVLGAFPAISMGVTRPTEFTSVDFPGSPYSKNIGMLNFDLSSGNRRVLLDGLARVAGALELIDDGQRELVETFTFPVTIYVPSDDAGELNIHELGQLFHDFNFLAEPVRRAQAIDLDQSDIHIILTNDLGASAVIQAHGGMERKAASLGRKSTALVAKAVLLRFVKIACEGYEFGHTLRDTPTDSRLTLQNFGDYKQTIESFLQGLADRMPTEFQRTNRQESILFSAPGWYTMGVIIDNLSALQSSATDLDKVLDKIAAIDWSRYNPDWLEFLGAPEVDDRGKPVKDREGRVKLGKSYGGEKAVLNLVDYVQKRTGLDKKMAALAAAAV